MKRKFKTIIIVFVLFITGIIGTFTRVSAAESFELPYEPFSYNVSDSFIQPIIESAYSKTISIENNYEPENSYFFYNTNKVYLVLKDDITTTNKQFAYYYRNEWLYRPMLIFTKGIEFNYNASNSGILFTSVQSGNATTFGVVDVNPNPFNYSRYYVGSLYYDSNYGHYSTSQLNSNYPTYFETSYIPPFVREDFTLYGLDLSINETSFYDWIIENNKLAELPSYITQSKLLSFIDFYSNFGGSFTNFLKNIPDWFTHMNILNQSKENVNILKSSMDRLYQEYINSFYREVGYHSSVELPHHRRNIETQTTDDDTTLITDDQNDTLIESILRDILRGVIQISNQIGDGVNSIMDKLSQLNFTTTIVNNGGNNDADTDVEGIDSDISDTMADSIEDVPTLDTEVPNLLSAPAVVGSTVNIYLNVFQSMGLDKILIFAVTVSFLIIKIRGNTK